MLATTRICSSSSGMASSRLRFQVLPDVDEGADVEAVLPPART
jgi:hypothetical protein